MKIPKMKKVFIDKIALLVLRKGCVRFDRGRERAKKMQFFTLPRAGHKTQLRFVTGPLAFES